MLDVPNFLPASDDSHLWHPDDPGAQPLDFLADTLPAATTAAQPQESIGDRLDAATLDLQALSGRTPPPRIFVWDQWIPAGEVTLMHGFGGHGKSLLAQQLATAVALGAPLFGSATIKGRALVLAGEDNHDEVWRRQVDICQRFGIDIDDVAENLVLSAVPHMDITIAQKDGDGGVIKGRFMDALIDKIEEVRPSLIILDNASLLFATDEICRTTVTRCIGMLKKLCHDYDATVLLISHNNRNGDYSGVSAWENAVRSRLALMRNDKDNITMLARPKANYAANGDTTMRWDAGSFMCLDETVMTPGERIDAETATRAHADIFLAALDTLARRGISTSHSPQAGNYAPKVILAHDLGDGCTKAQLDKALKLLWKEERIAANMEIGQRENRHALKGLGRT